MSLIKLTGCDWDERATLRDFANMQRAETILCAIGNYVLFEVNSETFRRHVEELYHPYCQTNGFEMVEVTSLGSHHLRAVIKHICSGETFSMDAGQPDFAI